MNKRPYRSSPSVKLPSTSVEAISENELNKDLTSELEGSSEEILLRNKLRQLLHIPSKRLEFRAFIQEREMDNTLMELALVRIQLWIAIRDFKESADTFRLAKAHFLWQKFLTPDAYEKPDALPSLVTEIHQIIWKDEDGTDTEKLLKYETFNNLEKWVEESLLWLYQHFLERNGELTPVPAINPSPKLSKKRNPAKSKAKKSVESPEQLRKSKKLRASIHSEKKTLTRPISPPSNSDSNYNQENDKGLQKLKIPIKQWTTEQVVEWLDEIELSSYKESFRYLCLILRKNVISGMDLLELSESELIELGLNERAIDSLVESVRLLLKLQKSLDS